MNIKDELKRAGAGVMDAIAKEAETNRRLKEEYENYSDDELVQKYKNSSGKTKEICAWILRDRGYK